MRTIDPAPASGLLRSLVGVSRSVMILGVRLVEREVKEVNSLGGRASICALRLPAGGRAAEHVVRTRSTQVVNAQTSLELQCGR